MSFLLAINNANHIDLQVTRVNLAEVSPLMVFDANGTANNLLMKVNRIFVN